MATPRLKRRICILGAGFLGLSCAQALLLNQCKNEVFEIIVLSKAFTPQTTSGKCRDTSESLQDAGVS